MSYITKPSGDNSTCEVAGRGTILIKRLVNNEWFDAKLEDVLYIPSLRKNLFSPGVCTAKGYTLKMEANSVGIYKDEKLKACGVRHQNNLYKMVFETTQGTELNFVLPDSRSLETWHKRLGHINCNSLREMIRHNLVNGVSLSNLDKFFCESCQFGKQHRLSFKPRNHKRETKIGEFIHIDLCGPMSEASIGGSRYFLLLKDDSSSFRYVYFLRHKDDVFEKFKEFENLVFNWFGQRIKTIRSDNGTEFRNKRMRDYMAARGIRLETSAPYIHEQNGRAEREIRTIVECARTMLNAKKLPIRLWAEAVNTAVYILNRCLSSQTKITPFELWYNKKPELAHMRIFGSDAYVHISKEHRKKWDAKSKKLILVGYQNESTNYRLYDPATNRVTVARDVVVNESTPEDSEVEENDFLIPSNDRIGITEERINETEMPREGNDVNAKDTNDGPKYNLRAKELLRPPERYEASFTFFDEPQTYMEAISGRDSKRWTMAIEEELDAHAKNETWTIVSMPKDCKPIGCKWVFKVKENPSDRSTRYKARLCAKGFSQRAGTDYGEILSPVVRYDSIRILLATAAQEDLEIGQFDIKTAFLNGRLEEDIYMQVPEGIETKEDGMICKLHRSIYGLKQAARCWNQEFKSVLEEFDLKPSEADQCIFHGQFGKEKVYIALYVDDGMIMASSKDLLNKVMNALREKFDMVEGNSKTFVRMEIYRDRANKAIFIHQTSYIDRILVRFGMSDAKSVSIPADPHTRLNTNENATCDNKIPYREAVGSLLFLTAVSRPDISYAVGFVSRFSNKYELSHWHAVQRILRYLLKTKNHGILYNGSETSNLVGYSDSDFASDLDTRRSTSGYVFRLANGPITWRSKRQDVVSLSTTEAEYIAASLATREITWLRKLLSDIGHKCVDSTKLYIDNESSIKLIRNPKFHSRTKHIDVQYHFIREKFENGIIDVEYIPSGDQLADIFTKPIPRIRFEDLRRRIGVVPYI